MIEEINLTITTPEIDYLKEIIGDELFSVSGLSNLTKDSKVKNELKILESIKQKLDSLTPKVATA